MCGAGGLSSEGGDVARPEREHGAWLAQDLIANEAAFYTALNKNMINPDLTAVQRQQVRNALKEMNVTTFARGAD